MPNGLIPRNLWDFPVSRASAIWEDLLEETKLDTIPSGLSAYEDEKGFYVDASLPGVNPKNIEITFDRGILRVKGKVEEEEKDKTYYRRATSLFAYNLALPEDVDDKVEPKVTCKNGVMHAVFEKKAMPKPRKIEVKVT